MLTLAESREDLIEILNPYVASLSAVGIELQPEDWLRVCEEILEQYQGYHATHDIMDLKALDDFKVIAWAPYLVCEVVPTTENDKKLLISTSIELLHGFVQTSGKNIDRHWLDKVTDVAFKGLFDEHAPYAIAKNGLYASFKTAARTRMNAKEKVKDVTVVHMAIEVVRIFFSA